MRMGRAGARKWKHLSVRHASDGEPIHSRHFLAVANHYSNSFDTDSALFLWDPVAARFPSTPFQRVPTSGANDLSFLSLHA